MQTLATYDLMVLAFGAIAFGFYLLIKGGDWAIEAAVYFAEQAGLSALFVGATVLAFGTSIPELFASINANISGFPGISLGNVIGSNIANILLVLGATALIYPLSCKPQEIRADIIMMLLASFGLLAAMQLKVIERIVGAGFFLVLVLFVAYQYKSLLHTAAPVKDVVDLQEPMPAQANQNPAFASKKMALAFLLGGFVALALGSELLVKGAVTIGMAIGIPEAIIGMTVVAFGTSLPELATCMAAAAKKQTQMLVGNVIGSNVFNIMSIVGLTAIVQPIVVDQHLTGISLWLMVAISCLIAIWFLLGQSLKRGLGALMVVCYLGVMSLQFF